MKKTSKIIMIVVIFLFLLSACYHKEETPVITEEVEEKEEQEEEIYLVDIKGSVSKPGVYEVAKGSRVMDVIEKAGGLKKDANTDFLNLSKKVEDGEILWVYTDKEIKTLIGNTPTIQYVQEACHCPDVQNSACVSKETNNANTKVNINTASLEELMTLSGIGEAKAKSIITYRQKTKFQKIEDIKNVSGIGDSVYEKIKDAITV